MGSLEARLCQPRLSLCRTAYINFRLLPFSQAIHFPIFVYGKVRFFMLNNRVEIKGKISKGMIKIGINGDSFSLFDHSGYILIGDTNAKIVFEGHCRIGVNTKIRCNSGLLKFGNNCRIGSNTRVICNGGMIEIGDNTGITFNCTIMNSSFHYIYDENKSGYINRSGNVIIGNNNWIGNNTTISTGTITPNRTIVSQRSLLNKDYSKYGECCLLGGIPARLTRIGLRRVFNPIVEEKVEVMFAKYGNPPFLECDEIKGDSEFSV